MVVLVNKDEGCCADLNEQKTESLNISGAQKSRKELSFTCLHCAPKSLSFLLSSSCPRALAPNTAPGSLLNPAHYNQFPKFLI